MSSKETQFKKGKSGNTKGRPTGSNMKQRLERVLSENNGKESQALIEAGVKAAKKGDFRFWSYIFDRMEGKTPDRIAGPDGRSLKIIIESATDDD